MYDFTKKELEGILLCIFHGSWMYKSDKHTVINKIQSMIDNYCEHEWENTCCSCPLDRMYCHKCDKNMDELN